MPHTALGWPVLPIRPCNINRGLVYGAALLHVGLWLLTLAFAWYVYVDLDKAEETLRASGRLLLVAASMSTAALGCTVIAAIICVSCVRWNIAVDLLHSVAGSFGMAAASLATAAQLIALLGYAQGLILYAVYEMKMSELSAWTPLYEFDNDSFPSATVERLLENSTIAIACHTMATMRLLTCVYSYKETYDLSSCCPITSPTVSAYAVRLGLLIRRRRSGENGTNIVATEGEEGEQEEEEKEPPPPWSKGN
jgi:hypothetical protein